MLLPSGVQTIKVVLKGEDLPLECIPEGLYVYNLCYYLYSHMCYRYHTVIFLCCSPTPTIEWMKLGDTLSVRRKLSNFNKLLTISAVEESDDGKYMCTAQNSAGKAVHYFDITVEGQPASEAIVVLGVFALDKKLWKDLTLTNVALHRTNKVADGSSSKPANCDWF